MTECLKGEHEFPVEDDKGAYCEEHGVTLLWHGPPITTEDLAPASRAAHPIGGQPALLLPAPRGDPGSHLD